MNFEAMEQWLIAHCPQAKHCRKVLNHLKITLVSRHTMKPDDRTAVEAGRISKNRIVKKYESKWKNYTDRILYKLEEYLECCGNKSFYDNYESVKDDVLFCNYAYGFMPDEYFLYRLMDKTPKEIQSFISERDRLIFIYKVNDIVDLDVYRNKNETYKLLLKYYKRDAVPIQNISNFNAFSSFIEKHPVFVQKGVRKNCGQGVEQVVFRTCASSKKEYFKKLIDQGEYLLEECIVQSKEMSILNESSVNTVRCVTLVTDREIVIDHCFLKVGRNQSFLDNAAAGGLLIGIDKKTGILNTEAYTEFLELYPEHPESKIKFKGYQLPDWDTLLQLAKELASVLPTVRFIGWDFAHTPLGWVLVEANGRSQVIAPQILYKKGLKDHFTSLMEVHF